MNFESITQPKLSRVVRIALVVGIALLAAGSSLFLYRYATQPVVLTVGAGSLDGEAAVLMSTIASRLASTNSNIRLKIVDTGTVLESSKAFSAGKVDLAVVRADIGDLSAARAVVLLTNGVVMIVVPPGSKIESVEDLAGHVVGVVGGEANQRVVDALTQEYDLVRAKVQFKNLALADVRTAVQSKQVSALLVVVPLSRKYLSLLQGFFDKDSKRLPGLIAIESAGAIAAIAPSYESYDLPKGTIRGSPAIPDDDLTTLRVPFYLVANKEIDDGAIGALAKSIMDIRGGLLGTNPLLAQISAPSTDSDAVIAPHPGAAAYFSGDQKTFLDKYGDKFFYASMLLGSLTSILAAAWKFMQDDEQAKNPLKLFHTLALRIRHSASETDLSAVEVEIDRILQEELSKYADGQDDVDANALSLAAHRLEHSIDQRRRTLHGSAVKAVA